MPSDTLTITRLTHSPYTTQITRIRRYTVLSTIFKCQDNIKNKKLINSNVCRPKPFLYKTDHRYPGRNVSDVPVVVLYAEIGTRKFSAFHTLLSERAEAGTLVYVLRHFVEVSGRVLLRLCSTAGSC